MAFLEEPRGSAIKLNELKNTAEKTTMDPTESKIVFTDDVLQECKEGRWLEVRMSAVLGGYVSSFGIGFTVNDPTKDKVLPRRGTELEGAVLFGYTGKVYWQGTSIDIDWHPAVDLRPMGNDEVGILLTNDGPVEIFVNRIKKHTFSPSKNNLTAVEATSDIWGLVDLWGGPQSVTIQKSAPPSSAEQEDAKEKMNQRKTEHGSAAASGG
eukprot:GEMP01052103.1.p1 GENE.GEMP01052103.1~~GEMP01052103.1.p1  ORF type:complete len:210 (+),score=56.98 GEMP01052103.1:79-708(+)